MNSSASSDSIRAVIVLLATVTIACPSAWGQLKLDQRPAVAGEWGYRPADDSVASTNPPSFSWRPQQNLTWQLQCARDAQFRQIAYEAKEIEFSVHCPPKTLEPGAYWWRYRGVDGKGQQTGWSKARRLKIDPQAVKMPMPQRAELLSRIPKNHPRLFMRPENIGQLRSAAAGPMKPQYQQLVRECERLLKNPPPTKEPPKYPDGMTRKGEEWRQMWWGNREYTIRALNGAATLAFTRLLGGREEYGVEAKRILLECAKWDPRGSTGYRYNDEAGMPYAYYFARTYTFVNDLLSNEEKALCRGAMKVRGEEMYRHLCPGHLWRPYSSHSNRAWHFLGEVGIAFLGEIDGAEDWVWFAANVFFNTYPVWSDDDGGWHEGSSYWSSYVGRFTWWADVMREAMGIDAYDKPFFSKVGYYAMYLLPPGKVGGGFGDLTARRTATQNRQLMTVLTAQAQNPHWQWYVDELGGPDSTGGYIGFVRGQLPKVEPKAPDDLPTSRLFAGTGQAYLNSNLTDASESVQVVFKSSPFGTQSHGYEANNSFLLWAYGKRLLIRSGYRDIYGSKHHADWMWSTRSTNCITVNGAGQKRHTVNAPGRITAFKTTDEIDVVVGEAGSAYEEPLKRFTRTILFAKPDIVVVYDRIEATTPSTYDYWLHATQKMDVTDQQNIRFVDGNVACDVSFLEPAGLQFTQTDQYDPNPRERIRLREWHLTATTSQAKKQIEFVAVYWPYRLKDRPNKQAQLRAVDGGYALKLIADENQLAALLPNDDSARMSALGLASDGKVVARLARAGKMVQTVSLQD